MAPGLGDYIATKESQSRFLRNHNHKDDPRHTRSTYVQSAATSNSSQAATEERPDVPETDAQKPINHSNYDYVVEQPPNNQFVPQTARRVPVFSQADSYPATTSGQLSSASPSMSSESPPDDAGADQSILQRLDSSPTPSHRPNESRRNQGLRPSRLAFPRHHVQKPDAAINDLQQPGETSAASSVLGLRDARIYDDNNTAFVNRDRGFAHAEVRPLKKPSGPVQQLDYPVDELYNMDYEQLENESFDIDPRNRGTLTEGLRDDMSLSDRLALVCDMPAEQQRQFMARLSAKDWEEAGSWFEREFAILNASAIECRQEKRELAKRHEQIVSQHFAAIKEESEQLQNICNDIAERGREVIRLASPGPISDQQRKRA